MNKKVGLNTVIKAAQEARVSDFLDDRQAMLPLLPAIAEDEDGEIAPAADVPRGRGRPKGSRNKATKELIAYYGAMGYRDPLLFLLETYNRPASVLAAELGCDPLEAFKLQIAAAREVKDYWHQKMPVQIESEAGLLNIIFQATPGTLIASGIDPTQLTKVEMIEDEEIEQNQEVTNPPQPKLNKPELDK